MIASYVSGADMWRDYVQKYGETEARGICNRYLDLQISNDDPEEYIFCRELYAAMRESLILKTARPPARDIKSGKASILGDLAEKKDYIANSPQTAQKNRDTAEISAK